MVVPSTQQIKPGDKVLHKIYHVPLASDYLDILIRLEVEGRKFESVKKLPETLASLWEGALNSTELLNELKVWLDCLRQYGIVWSVSWRASWYSKSWNFSITTKPVVGRVPHGAYAYLVFSTTCHRIYWSNDFHRESDESGAYVVGKLFVILTYDRIRMDWSSSTASPLNVAFRSPLVIQNLLSLLQIFLGISTTLLPGMNYMTKPWILANLSEKR